MTTQQLSMFGEPRTRDGRDGATPRSQRRMASTSLEAWRNLDTTPGQRKVIDILRRFAPRGLTSAEVAVALQTPLHKISGRFTELRDLGAILDTGDRRDGAKVWRLA